MSIEKIKNAQEKIPNPFARGQVADHVSHGTVAIEQERAIATAQAKVIAAKRFPRNPAECFEKIREVCQDLGFAEQAFYSYPRGGEIVHGASIRLAEELARIWGNIDCQVIELSRRDGETEMMAVAWDMETNTSSSVVFTVKHHLDTRKGRRELTDERDIRDLAANIAARKMRGRILAVLPDTLIRAAIDVCRDTLARSVAATLDDTREALVGRLRSVGVSERAICGKFGVRNINQLDARQVAALGAIWRTIEAGEASAAEIFELGLTSKEIKERAKKASSAEEKPKKQKNQKKQEKKAPEPETSKHEEPEEKTETVADEPPAVEEPAKQDDHRPAENSTDDDGLWFTE